MSKITEKVRKMLRKIFMFAGAGCISLLFQACYGVYMDNYQDINIQGRVRCKDTENPIFGINVSIQGMETYESWNRTDINGNFNIYVPKEEAEYTIIFKDVDEEYNGGWFITKTEEIKVSEDAKYYNMDIFLDKKD